MPIPMTRHYTLYTFDELSESAKEKARAWYREASNHDEWWDSVYEDALRMAEIIGIEIDYRHHPGRNGRSGWSEPKIGFSGFWSQGDGASWEGRYRYAKGALKKLQEEAPAKYQYGKEDGSLEETVNPSNLELHRIAKGLQDVQRRHFYRLEATSTHRGHCLHSGCMSIEVQDIEDPYRDIGDAEDDVTDLLRDFADWIYRRLEEEYEWLNSDEQVDESIRCNEYTFDEDGNRED